MNIKIFGKEGCAKCQTTKNKMNHFLSKWKLSEEIKIDFFDMATVDGMTEGAFMDVSAIPVTVIENDGLVLIRWDGEVPKSKEVKEYLYKGDTEWQKKETLEN